MDLGARARLPSPDTREALGVNRDGAGVKSSTAVLPLLPGHHDQLWVEVRRARVSVLPVSFLELVIVHGLALPYGVAERGGRESGIEGLHLFGGVQLRQVVCHVRVRRGHVVVFRLQGKVT